MPVRRDAEHYVKMLAGNILAALFHTRRGAGLSSFLYDSPENASSGVPIMTHPGSDQLSMRLTFPDLIGMACSAIGPEIAHSRGCRAPFSRP